MAEEYYNEGKKQRWASGMRSIRDAAQSLYDRFDQMPNSPDEERRLQLNIEDAMRDLQRRIDSFISQDLY